MNTSARIQNTLLEWKTLPIKTLIDVVLMANYSTVMNTIHKMKKKGLVQVESINAVRNNKLIHPTKKLLQILDVSNELVIEHSHLSHDSMVSAFCLAMKKLGCIKDAQIEDYLRNSESFDSIKGFYPDAVLTGEIDNNKFSIPVEVELNQKSETRIIEKFKNYINYSTYTDVLFSFVDRRVAEKYDSVLNELKIKEGKSNTNFIFCCADYTDFIHSDIEQFTAITESTESKLKEIFNRS